MSWGTLHETLNFWHIFPGGSDLPAEIWWQRICLQCRTPIFDPRLGRSPGEGLATHSRILAWRIPCTEEPGGLQSQGCKEQDTTWEDSHFLTHLNLMGRIKRWNLLEDFIFNYKTNIVNACGSSLQSCEIPAVIEFVLFHELFFHLISLDIRTIDIQFSFLDH